ncbi:hypothetical protein PCASD_04719 [Puccinia coronata f. sp. avenae]|uniref:Uncharacterized protein n=1 Tax=Puccinia coronata f. sp. avenae TaxID=200324 RepID=A0A2N5UYX0_9BASI|nr:hypothetical protein PCASD_08388 [Puccinia coronata f. sp. avenae]PLW42933.1 hypothetical protein PCASD_04719 [Puccinia coronata f. sp. avenae]
MWKQPGGQSQSYAGSIMGWFRNRPSDFFSKQHSGGQSPPPADNVSPPPITLSASDRPPRIGGGIGPGHLIAKAYRSALKDIELSIFALANHHPVFSTAEFKARTRGVPGTQVASNAERQVLQRWLDCTSGEGEWRWEPLNDRAEPRTITVHKQGPREAKCERAFYEHQGAPQSQFNRSRSPDGWQVRPSLKFRWYPSSRCETLRPKTVPTNQPLSRRSLCRLLRHKSILLVGDVSQYSLHDLLLDWTSTKQASCAGNLYCKIHPICSDELGHHWDGNSSQLESGELDAHVYFKMPTQPFKQSYFSVGNDTHTNDHYSPSLSPSKSNGRGTFLRYRRSDSLWASSSPTDDRFQPIWLHPNNGIRDINNFWYGDIRKSDLIILSKRPLGLPRHSHLRQAFAHNKHLSFHHLEYLRKHSHSQVWRREVMLAPDYSDGITSAVSLIKIAIKMVLEVWLPEVLFTLFQLQKSHQREDRLIVWRGEWRVHGDCLSPELNVAPQRGQDEFDWDTWWKEQQGDVPGDGRRPHPTPPDLVAILFPNQYASHLADDDVGDKSGKKSRNMGSDIADWKLKNPRLVFHNLEVIFQNQLMRKLAPELGVLFLDLESQASVWRTGLVASPTLAHLPPGPSDCFHYCFPSPGLTLEESFLGGLMKILLAAGWNDSTGTGSKI